MEKAQEFNEEEYLKYLNYGYYISKYAPEMSDLIVNAIGDKSKLTALKDGREIYLDEELDDFTPDWLKKNHFEDKSQNDIDKDIEPDI